MDRTDSPLHDVESAPAAAAKAAADQGYERTVVDRLPDAFPLARSESEWLLTLLSADDLRYIFDGRRVGGGKE